MQRLDREPGQHALRHACKAPFVPEQRTGPFPPAGLTALPVADIDGVDRRRLAVGEVSLEDVAEVAGHPVSAEVVRREMVDGQQDEGRATPIGQDAHANGEVVGPERGARQLGCRFESRCEGGCHGGDHRDVQDSLGCDPLLCGGRVRLEQGSRGLAGLDHSSDGGRDLVGFQTRLDPVSELEVE